jgi:hypothetical protein
MISILIPLPQASSRFWVSRAFTLGFHNPAKMWALAPGVGSLGVAA